MSDDRFAALAQILAFRDGTVAHPKGDGRVEIPHGIVRLMGWRDKSIVSVERGEGCLFVSDDPTERPIGRISISMERARIPMSMMRAAGMDGEPVVIIPSLTDRCVSVWPSIIKRRSDLAEVLREAGPDICNRLMGILTNRERVRNNAQPTVLSAEQQTAPQPSLAPKAVSQPTNADDPKLFVMDTLHPMVVRVVGMPFEFQSHWVPVDNGTGHIVPHSSDCQLCDLRSPERMFLVPVIRKKHGETAAGFLLAQEDLRTKMARQVAGKNPIKFDLVLYYVPYSEGMCSVYKSPPEDMPESQIAAAQATCSDPNTFIAKTFIEPDCGVPIVSARAPMFIVEGHFATNARPHNPVK